MQNRLASLLRLAAALGMTLIATTAAHAQSDDDGGEQNPCPGCVASLNLGATVAVPGITIGMELADPTPDDGEEFNPNGSCQLVSEICVPESECKFFIKYTFSSKKKVALRQCRWIQNDAGTWYWWCIDVNPTFQGDSSHIESDGTRKCGTTDLLKIELGAASQAFSLVCSQCD